MIQCFRRYSHHLKGIYGMCCLASPWILSPWTRNSRLILRSVPHNIVSCPWSRPHTCSPRICWLQDGDRVRQTITTHLLIITSRFTFYVPCRHCWIAHACFWQGSLWGIAAAEGERKGHISEAVQHKQEKRYRELHYEVSNVESHLHKSKLQGRIMARKALILILSADVTSFFELEPLTWRIDGESWKNSAATSSGSL